MDFVGIDLHKTSSQIYVLNEGGELTERRIKSTSEAFNEVFADRPPARILGGGGEVAVRGEVRQVPADLIGAHL
jgi:hypothetical protein